MGVSSVIGDSMLKSAMKQPVAILADEGGSNSERVADRQRTQRGLESQDSESDLNRMQKLSDKIQKKIEEVKEG